MKQLFRLSIFVLLLTRSLLAADAPSGSVVNPVYIQRADKIVATLGVTDPAKSTRVRDAIAAHYSGVNVIDDAVDSRVKELKKNPTPDKAADAAAIKAVQDEATPKLDQLHADFLAKLSAELTPAQIDQVKDGLTYSVLKVTMNAYEKMLPKMTAEQRTQILAYLTEAREHAMDAGTSEAKHGWFGKYKGKINNYLSKAGIDMKEAEKNLTKKS